MIVCDIDVKLARRNRVFAENFSQKHVRAIKTSPFDAELNSASNGDIFIPRTSFGKISPSP